MARGGLRNLADLDKVELKAFFDSFDNVLCDCDGVLWTPDSPIVGIARSISKLKQIGKQVRAVTNNCTRGIPAIHQRFQKLNYDIEIDDIVYPTRAIVHYFKSVGFEKEVYLLGSKIMRDELVAAGIQIADTGELFCEETMEAVLKNLVDNNKIGAVIFDFGMNCTYLAIARAAVYLDRPEVLFITGATDKGARFPNYPPLIGIGGYQESLQEFTGRKPICLGKPGKEFADYLQQKFNIKDSSRTLFIGDSLMQDIHFANEHGYQSLLVLTGQSTLEDAQKCKDDVVADFYVDSLGDICDLISKAFDM